MLWPNDTVQPDCASCSESDFNDFASQPGNSYPSPPWSQQPPASSTLIPSAQPVYYPSLPVIIDPITPCPSLPSITSLESFAFVTPPRSPSSSQFPTRHAGGDEQVQSELLDSVVDGIAKVTVSMDRDEAGRWRIRRLPEDD